MRRVIFAMVFAAQFAFGQMTLQKAFNQRAQATIEDFALELPPGWSLHQDFIDNGKLVLGFAKDNDFVSFYVSKERGLDVKKLLTQEAKVMDDKWSSTHAGQEWDVFSASRTMPEIVGGGTNYIVAFSKELNGKIYYGFARSQSESRAKDDAYAFLDRLSLRAQDTIAIRSLTGPDYTGKKYYFGFGAAMQGDPSMMQNEVKYDVLHTHDIFTKEIGGNYLATKYTSYKDATRSNIVKEWKRIGDLMTWDDMYVQYSSGHGSEDGLAVGVSYNDIRDNALSYPAKEIIIWTMACFSGNLVDAFNSKKADWEHFPKIGRTLMVMTSSAANDESSTGPGTDPSEPGGPNGSAGSAFGYSLWKSLIGEADGMIDGVKDGYLSLGEIEKYTVKRTKEVGGHTPQITGAYNQSLIMNRVPPKSFLDSFDITSEGLSDAELRERIEALDKAWRI